VLDRGAGDGILLWRRKAVQASSRCFMNQADKKDPMNKRMTMIYWKGEKFWLGKLLEYPEIMTQGETLEELEENLRDAYSLMILDDVPEGYQTKEINV
jgi:predicted RNase H-like HicB family nuclease